MPSAYQITSSTYYPWATGQGVANLRLNNDVPKPSLSDIPAGHVLVNMKAASVAPRDLMVLSNDPIYPFHGDLDLSPGADGAGIINAVGENVQDWEAGERVLVSPLSWKTWKYGEEMIGHTELNTKGERQYQGTLREYLIVSANELIKAPKYLSYEELAVMPASSGTAAHALFFGPRALKPGQTVLTQGTGGVSCFVTQLASAIGATVIVTSSSSSKLEVAKQLGATHTINYAETTNWADEVLKLTNGAGVDFVVEIGGSATIAQSIAATKQGGVIALVGFLTGQHQSDIVLPIIFGGKTLYGVRSFTTDMIEYAVKTLAAKEIRPAVGKVSEWEEAGRAFEELVKGASGGVGKSVVKVGKNGE